ncbi:MAG: SUMF1/EgtB/PvdO family nonheme iron enzyme [Polyangiaceae bacterium]
MVPTTPRKLAQGFRHGALLLGLQLFATNVLAARDCPDDMVRVDDYCIDRFEASLVERASLSSLSPYYPPGFSKLTRIHAVWQVERRLVGSDDARLMPLPPIPRLQRKGAVRFMAQSRAGVIPNGYLSYYDAANACDNAGKRLCSEAEWTRACRGPGSTKYGYGANYEANRCNVFRSLHPAAVLHGQASLGHTDPRLNLVVEGGVGPLLRVTGALSECRTRWQDDAVFDMVGNLDEWIADPKGVFVGGFYARSTSQGCEAKIASHAPGYYDYSLGTRCCRDATPPPAAAP